MTQAAFFVHGQGRTSDWVVTCDHATNHIPSEVGGGSLGMSAADMARHIAFDIGASGVATALADALGAPAVLSNFSRLVIDPNRGEDDPTLVMQLYDGTVIPENRAVDQTERERRITSYYRPYHAAVAAEMGARANPILVSVHSFTQRFKGRDPRPWHVAVLHTDDTRLSDPLLAALRAEGDLVVGQNEPYSGVLKGDAVDRHATAFGHPNALIEIRNDLIETAENQQSWAARLARCLDAARAAANL